MRALCTVLLCVITLFFVGCGTDSLLGVNTSGGAKGGQAARGVAVIDIDTVAKQVGRFDAISQQVSEKTKSLNSELAQEQLEYRNEVQEAERALSAGATDEQVARVTQLKRARATMLLRSRKQAQANLSKFRAEQIQSFREEVKPIAQQVASARGLSLVVSKNDSVVFSYEPTIDITSDVIARMQSMRKGATRGTQTRATPLNSPSLPAAPPQQRSAQPSTLQPTTTQPRLTPPTGR